MRRLLIVLAVMAATVLALGATRLLVQAPAVRDSNAAGQFDASRAQARLAMILGDERPHPTDSAGNDAVRARLMAQIRGLGLNPIVRDQFACNTIYKQRGVTCARVRNILVALGPTAGKAVLLNAHYDSTPVGPAAGDDGVGVATLLEVGAILKRESLNRRVLLLFNEGEELGLLGARAFLSDPLSDRVDSLVNLEARGTTGPVSMFETSVPNGPAIHAFRKAVERPFANSLATDFYRQLPNYTDVNSFSERGWTTLNFAMIGNETRYHSAGDTLAALDAASLQHMGDQTLAVTRELASGAREAGGNLLFADVAGRQLVVLPDWLGFALLDIFAAIFAVAAFRRGRWWRGVAAGVAGLALAVALDWLAMGAVGLLRSGEFWRAHPFLSQLAAYASGVAGAAAALALVARPLSVKQMRAGYWLLFLILGIAVQMVAPGGVIYFLFPPLAMLAGMIAKQERIGGVTAAGLLLLTLGEVLALLGDLMVAGPFFILALLAALIALPLLIEAKTLLDAAGRRGTVGTGLAVVLAGTVAVAAAPAYSADRQQKFTVQHVTVTTAGKSYWSVLNDQSPLPAGFGGRDDWEWRTLPSGERKRWLAPAGMLTTVRPPTLTVMGRGSSGARRIVQFRMDPNGAESVTLTAPEGAKLLAAGSGPFIRPFAKDAIGRFDITCYGRSCGRERFILVFGSAEPVTFTLIGSRRGLPEAAEPLLAARPQNSRPQYGADSTMTMSRVRL